MGVWGIYFTEIFFHFLRIFFYVFFKWKFFEFFFWKFFFGFFSIRGVLYRGNYKLCWNPHFYGTFLVLLIYNYLSRTMTGQKGSGGTHGAGFFEKSGRRCGAQNPPVVNLPHITGGSAAAAVHRQEQVY